MGSMTPTDIDAMEAGRAMDALVAEHVFGQSVRWIHWADWSGQTHASKEREDDEPLLANLIDGKRPVKSVSVPEYSTDFAAAWQVQSHFHPDDSLDGYNVEMQGHGGGYSFGIYKDGTCYWGEGPTAQLAICRAALKAVLQAVPA